MTNRILVLCAWMLAGSLFGQYQTAWKVIDDLDKYNFTKAALGMTDALYAQIKRDTNSPLRQGEMIKALLCRTRLSYQLTENDKFEPIQQIEKEMPNFNASSRAVLYSLLAELYFKQAEEEYEPSENNQDKVLIALKMMWLSLEDVEATKISLAGYTSILEINDKSWDVRFEPYLYDVLWRRAKDIISEYNSLFKRQANSFYLERAAELGSAEEYLRLDWSGADSTSKDMLMGRLYKGILGAHIGDKDATALVFRDLERLNYMASYSLLKEAESAYKSQLEAMLKRYKGQDVCAMILHKLAEMERAPEAALRLVKAGQKYKDSYGAMLCKAHELAIISPIVGLKIAGEVAANKPILVRLDYKNVAKLHYRVVRKTAALVSQLDTMSMTEQMLCLRKQPIISQGEWALPTGKKYTEHSAEASLAGVGYGKYYIFVSIHSDFSYRIDETVLLDFAATDLAYRYQRHDSHTTYWLLDKWSGQPLAGANVEALDIYRDNSGRDSVVVVQKMTTDSSGAIQYTYEYEWKENLERSALRFVRGGDTLEVAVNEYYTRPTEANIRYKESVLLLDRAVYRPGQVVYFKGIAYYSFSDSKKVELTHEKRKIKLYNSSNIPLQEVEVTPNAYGSYSGSFTLPSDGLLGQMYIRDNESNAAKAFAVEEYKRKKFSLYIDEPIGTFALDSVAKISGLVQGNAGTASSGARLRYKISRREVDDDLYNFRAARIWIAAGDTVCDEEGHFVIAFKAVGDKRRGAEKQFIYDIEITATDLNGESQSKQTSITIGKEAFALSLEAPKHLARNRAGALRLSAKNLSNFPLHCNGELTIEALETPKYNYQPRQWGRVDTCLIAEERFNSELPNYAYFNKLDTAAWPVRKTLKGIKFDTKQAKQVDLASLLAQETAGLYRVKAIAKDSLGQSVESVTYFELFEPQSTDIPTPSPLFLAEAQMRVEPDSIAVLDFGSSSKDAHIFLYVEFEGQPLAAQWFKGGQRIKYPIKIEEKHRGNIYFQLVTLQHGHVSSETGEIIVPFSNKQLKIEYESFRNKLQPGQEETWTLKISGPKGEKVAAELAAAMYDAALDDIAPHDWGFFPYSGRYFKHSIENGDLAPLNESSFDPIMGYLYAGWLSPDRAMLRTYQLDNLASIYWGEKAAIYAPILSYKTLSRPRKYHSKNLALAWHLPPPPPPSPAPLLYQWVDERITDGAADSTAVYDSNGKASYGGTGTYTVVTDANGNSASPASPPAPNPNNNLRRNLSELVFFYPHLYTDAEGRVVLKFMMNEALTRWRLLLLAHTKELAIGQSNASVVTQKELMIQPNLPRFLRQGDTIQLVAKVSTMSKAIADGKARLELYNGENNQPINTEFMLQNAHQTFSLDANRSLVLRWRVVVPQNWDKPVVIRCYAEGNQHTDGEENTLPTVSNRILLTETLAMHLPPKQNSSFDFARISSTQASSTAQPLRYTVEFTQNPVWYAIQALPYLAEYPYECSEQLFSRLYANSISAHIAQRPDIKTMITQWQRDSSAKSPLLRNQNLKSTLVEATPWLLESQKNHNQQLATLLDSAQCHKNIQKIIDKLEKRQHPSGLFPWFDGGYQDVYISQHILAAFGQLQRMQIPVSTNVRLRQMLNKTLAAVDEKQLVTPIKNQPTDWLTNDKLHYLYARSFYNAPSNPKYKNTIDSISAAATKNWAKLPRHEQALVALALHRSGDRQTPKLICQSFLQNTISHPEFGLYWKTGPRQSWYNSDIETHCLMIEAFDEIMNDQKTVEALKTWLIKQKQTRAWPSTKSTIAACYALFMRGLSPSASFEPLRVSIGTQVLAANKGEAGSGYFQQQWTAPDLPQNMSNINVQNPNTRAAWGAAYWQYFEDADKATAPEAKGAVSIQKQLVRKVNTADGPQFVPLRESDRLRIGEPLSVQIIVKTDRALDYVHLKDMRAAGLEPEAQLSQYQHNATAGYYLSPRDLSTDFFFTHLPAGQHEFRYTVYAQHAGHFSNGITTLQCMYAPEFASHTAGLRIAIGE